MFGSANRSLIPILADVPPTLADVPRLPTAKVQQRDRVYRFESRGQGSPLRARGLGGCTTWNSGFFRVVRYTAQVYISWPIQAMVVISLQRMFFASSCRGITLHPPRTTGTYLIVLGGLSQTVKPSMLPRARMGHHFENLRACGVAFSSGSSRHGRHGTDWNGGAEFAAIVSCWLELFEVIDASEGDLDFTA